MSRSGSATGPPTPQAGTLAYSAPEQLQGNVRYTAKVAVFTFGLIAYEIIKGKPAFESSQSSELQDPPSHFGSFMQDLIRRCWSLKADERPSFADIFDEFAVRGWKILPEADPNVVGESVDRVLKLERHLKH
jgi:serine/threonine protein kinase